MVGFSEVLQTMAAMILFSIILLTSNKIIFLNSQKVIESEAEKRALTIAQTFIDEARVLPFDANAMGGPPSKVPEGFSIIGADGATQRADFNDFDDYHNWSELLDWKPESGDAAFQVDIEVLYVSSPNYTMNSGYTGTPFTEYKKMVVTVTSDYLKDGKGEKIKVQIPYLRQYYKTQ